MKTLLIIIGLISTICVKAQEMLNYSKSLENRANQGNAQAQCELGVCYAFGLGVEENDSLAVVWYRKAAAQNNELALHNLGVMTFGGEGTDKDCKEGLNYLLQAQKLGFKLSAEFINKVCSEGYEKWGGYDDVELSLYDDFPSIEQIKVKEKYLRQISSKSPSASLYLGYLAQEDDDYEKALEYFLNARKLFYPDGKTFTYSEEEDPVTGGSSYYSMEAYVYDALGYYYEFGLGMPKPNLEKAALYYSSSEVRSDLYPAYASIAPVLREALCYRKMGNWEKYFKLLNENKYFTKGVIFGGIPKASLWLGEAYFKGEGVAKDYKKALDIFEDLSNAKGYYGVGNLYEEDPGTYADCCYRIYQIYSQGLGIAKNTSIAKMYFDEALKYGSTSALYDYKKKIQSGI